RLCIHVQWLQLHCPGETRLRLVEVAGIERRASAVVGRLIAVRAELACRVDDLQRLRPLQMSQEGAQIMVRDLIARIERYRPPISALGLHIPPQARPGEAENVPAL